MARGDSPLRAAFRLIAQGAATAATVAVLAGCPPRTAAPDPTSEIDQGEAKLERERLRAREAFAPMVAAHNARVALLETFEAPAATVLRYPDGDRVQEDQLDGFIYLATRGRGAFELRLLGKTWAWLGGDGARSWIYFSPPNEPSRLHVYERLVDGARADATEVVGTAELTLLTPVSLRFLLGLAPIASDWSVVEAAPAPAGGAGSMFERFEVSWSPTPATVARARLGADGMPGRVVVCDLAGNEIARATLSEFERVQRPDLAIGAWPRTATKVVIEAPRSKASARLAIDRDALVRRTPRARDEFFNLDDLQLYLAPTEVVYHDANGAARPNPAAPAPAPQKGP
ncbi:MAG: hypothetical protein RLY21_435 [Planctomycetota bacterium]